ncbi:MAG: hypothetical protein NC132_02710 [Corallococcus sp.]|nr:hypothetical protein [Corallococcus sp.]MCM1359020.1 hypothetical protein [Corallococcus sp.]MCM1395009.1 hypothetical protein [Corallococcus sp.]
MEKFLTSAALWQDFDPAAEPLDINLLKTAEQDGIVTQTVYFTGRTVADGKTRVLAKVCQKASKTAKPAVLIIDSYKNPIDEDELKYWAQNGFVAMAIDYAGRCTDGLCTLYPSSLDYCNGDSAQSYFYVGDNAKQSKIYDYALNSMRAVTYLLQNQNAKSVSVVTVKKGVSVGAVVLGTDKRIQSGAVVFGSLYREYPPYEGDDEKDIAAELAEDELTDRLNYEEKRQMWTAGIAPQSYAMQTTVPVYVVCSAISPYVDAVSTDKMYYRLNDDSRMLLLPDVMEYLPDEYTRSIVKWLKGATANEDVTLEPFTDEQGNRCVKVEAPDNTGKIELWYCRNADNRARNWVQATMKKSDEGYIATLDLYSANCKIAAFALIHGAVDITTALCEIDVEGATNLKIPVRSVYSGSADSRMIAVGKSESWHGDKHKVEYCKGYLDIEGAKGKAMATFALNDPCVNGVDVFTVSFDVCCNVAQTLSVIAMCDFGKENNSYVQTVQLSGDGKWQRVTLDYSNFHSMEDAHQMSDDEQVQMLSFVADDEFIVNNVFLV